MPPTKGEIRKAIMNGWEVERDSPTPMHTQLRDRLAHLIAEKILLPGERVPSERTLASWLGVSRITARMALDGLAGDNAVQRGTGRAGTLVTARVSHDLSRFSGFTEIVRRHGHEVTTRLLSLTTGPAEGGSAETFAYRNGEPVHRIRRLRMISGEPSTLEDTIVPVALFPDLLVHDLRGSLYELFADPYDLAPARAVERISAVAATLEQARLLEIGEGDPLLRVERVAYSKENQAIEYSIDLHRRDQVDFVVHSNAAR